MVAPGAYAFRVYLTKQATAAGTRMTAQISDNIISGTKTPMLVENDSTAPVTGMNNWLPTNASTGTLTGSIESAAPGFRNAASAHTQGSHLNI
ncbi:MAG: hypothetical protein ACYDH9_13140 [Limisphaerales bacterium]